MSLAVSVFFVFGAILWRVIATLRDLEGTSAKSQHNTALLDLQVQDLTRRLHLAEEQLASTRRALQQLVAITPRVVPPPPPAPAPVLEKVEEVQPLIAPPLPPEPPRAEPPPLPPPVTSPPIATPPVRVPELQPVQYAPPKTRRSRDDWEALVGGNLLNKVGALVLVIGIALFLGYSLTRLSPSGRALTALAVSLTVLIGGVFLERHPRYQAYSRAVIGAGWAALYATAYAMYAVPAALIIHNAFLGSLLLVAVAGGMILHSLRYAKQVVTAIAFFAAFAALAVSESSPFAVIALLPLAAGLLYLSHRFSWNGMALFGVVATYGTCIAKGSSNASIYSVEGLFLAYWLLFEIFDLLRLARRSIDHYIAFLFPLNAAGFLGLSYLAWMAKAPDRIWQMSAFAALLFLVSALARYRLRPPAGFTGTSRLQRLEAGSFEAAFTISALLAGLAIIGRATGVWIAVGLAVEAEAIYGAGLLLDLAFLRWLGTLGFAASLASATLNAIAFFGPPKSVTLPGGHQVSQVSPALLFHAALFYINRVLRRPNVLYSSMASALVLVVLAVEVDARVVGFTFLVFSTLLFEVALRWKAAPTAAPAAEPALAGDFRWQSQVAAALGAIVSLISPREPLALGLTLALTYYRALRFQFRRPGDALPVEGFAAAWGGAAAITGLAYRMIWILIPSMQDRVFALFVLAGVFFELGVRRLPWTLRVSSYVTAAVAVLTPLFENQPFWVIYSQHDNHLFLVQVGCALCAVALLFRARSIESSLLPGEQRRVVHAFSMLTLLCSAFAILDRSDPFAALGWALLALAWWHLGAFLKDSRFQIHANLLLAIVFFRLMFWNLADHSVVGGIATTALTLIPVALIRYYLWWRSPGTDAVPSGKGIAALHLWAAAILLFSEIGVDIIDPWRPAAWMLLSLALVATGQLSGIGEFRLQGLLAALPVFAFGLAKAFSGGAVLPVSIAIALLFAAQFFLPRNSSAPRTTPFNLAERDGRFLMSIVGTVLLTALLYHQFPGGWLTTAWGIEGLALLILGFPLRERVFRMEGLALLLFCILKLFLYDLRNLETLFRILSFIALGVILLGVSLLYTRFGERIRRYL